MSEVRVNNLSNENNTGGPNISGITTYSGKHFFVPPQGTTAERPSDCEPGSLRFNTDTAHLEYFRGNTIGWVEIEAELTAPLGGGTGSNEGLGTRMIFMGGTDGSSTLDVIEFITISTLGNVQDFGNLISSEMEGASCSSRTRGFYFGGDPADNDIEFITFASLGNATDFGNCTANSKSGSGCSDQTRGIQQLGYPGPQNNISFITMATTGDALDFGDLVTARHTAADAASPIYAFIAGGNTGDNIGNIERMTISTLGSSQDFGDLSEIRGSTPGGASNSTIAIFTMGRSRDSVLLNTIEIMNMSTQGSAKSFGLINEAGSQVVNATSSATRAIAMGGMNAPNNAKTDSIHSITFSSNGGSEEFGDLIYGRTYHYATSDSHGGLGGY